MKMAYQGVALLIAAVIGIGFAAYQYYTNQNAAHTYDEDKSHSYTYIPPPEETVDGTEGAGARKRRKAPAVEKCSICQETLVGHVRKLVCSHTFHKDCIGEWFKESRTCPVCRRVL